MNEDTKHKPSVQVIQGLSLNLGAYMKLKGMVALHAQRGVSVGGGVG